MAKHLLRDLERLKKSILGMGALVEAAINKATASFTTHREDLASEVLAGDDDIDEVENAIEDECLKILALHQPVASDLRFVVMVLKVNHDLERMGDLATNIAERTVDLLKQPPLAVDLPLDSMCEVVSDMVRRVLNSLVERDATIARDVIAADERVDDMHRDMFRILERSMRENSDTVAPSVSLLGVSRYLERIADHATNIAEDVVFLIEGESIRHAT